MRKICSAMLPSSARATPFGPCLPMMTRSGFVSSMRARSRWPASPRRRALFAHGTCFCTSARAAATAARAAVFDGTEEVGRDKDEAGICVRRYLPGVGDRQRRVQSLRMNKLNFYLVDDPGEKALCDAVCCAIARIAARGDA
jgi:hypothetical protein